MCGIFGHFTPAMANSQLVYRMGQLLAHRGPDGYDIFSHQHLAFGAGRLAIIDLSAPVGPLFNEDNTIGVIFNGEIYNYRELRANLETCGHIFRTHTDTEVLVHGYEQWGKDLPTKLRGMFAFCIYDQSAEELFLARDRLGEKPLYYTRTASGEFVFASEIKAILLHEDIHPQVNRDALPYYLTLGYIPPPMSMFAGIHKLAAACTLIVRLDGIHEGRYWQASTQTNSVLPETSTISSLKHELREHIEDAVRSRMISDVPIGALLSGGVDSSAVVAMMQASMHEQVNTFTVGFDFKSGSYGDSKFNVDLHHAKIAAEHIGTHHHAIIINDDFVPELLPHLVYQMDEPIAQHSIIQNTYVTALARSMNIPVLLTGDAGDELFLGYSHYLADQKLSRIHQLPKSFRHRVLKPLIEHFLPRYNDYLPKLTVDDPVIRYLEWMRFLRISEAQALLQDKQTIYEDLHTSLQKWLSAQETASFTERIAYTSLNLWIPEDSNMRVDKTSMLMSVETRAPLEDHHLVDFALQIPVALKLRNGLSKWIFKEVLRDLLPESILNREKWGFIPPTSDWLRTNLRPLVETYLSQDYLESAGLCDPAVVRQMVNEHMSRQGYHVKPLWALLILHMWHAIYIDKTLSLSHKISEEEIVSASQIETSRFT